MLWTSGLQSWITKVKSGTILLRSAGISRKLHFSGALPENEFTAYVMSFWMVELDPKQKAEKNVQKLCYK
ncbi:hypothetical protein U0355_03085 [Salimicrobium sp. PL1-032A]|uniref:hypothetical protein n=1 Tax=Salimicrobium sp. PL1-032A TaxID=3095364 RepID=UPI0032609201